MWCSLLQKHFPGSVWKKHYSKIIFYVSSVLYGPKPSFLWDFGSVVDFRQIFNFIENLKLFLDNVDSLLIVVINDDILIVNTKECLKTLFFNRYIIQIVNNDKCQIIESEKIDQVKSIINVLADKFKQSHKCDFWILDSKQFCCPPCLYGLLLNYPLVYFFEFDYKPFQASLLVFSVSSQFSFKGETRKFLLFSFSIPKDLVTSEIELFVTEWFNSLKYSVKSNFSDLSMESSFEDVDALIL